MDHTGASAEVAARAGRCMVNAGVRIGPDGGRHLAICLEERIERL